MSIAENLIEIRKNIPQGVKLIAVSKTMPMEIIQEAYVEGQRVFGENKPQELRDKYEVMAKDIEWHLIGHLQTNKVKYIAPFVYLIHSVDSIRLLNEINKEAIKNNRVINCLLQIDIAHEDTKFGLLEEEARGLILSDEYKSMKNIKICGVMGIGSITDDENQTRKEFINLKEIFTHLRDEFFKKDISFCEISMGMSSDFSIAIKEGSTMVRIGSSIFGERNYLK